MRVPLELKKSWRLFNHGPVALVSASAGGVSNLLAAAWVTPLDFDPPKLTVVLAADTYTRELALRSGALVLQVPTVSMLSIVEGVGTTSGRDVDAARDARIHARRVERQLGEKSGAVESSPTCTSRRHAVYGVSSRRRWIHGVGNRSCRARRPRA